MKPEERFTQVLVAFLMAVAFLVVGHLATTDSPSSVRAGGKETCQTDTIPSPSTLAADEKSSGGNSIADLTKTTEPAPEDPNAYIKRASAYVEKGEYDLAITALTKVIQLAPEDPNGYFDRAIAYIRNGESDLAIADFTKIIQLKPEYPSAYELRACIYAKIDEYDLAIADFTKVIQLKPDDPNAYSRRGYAYAQIDEWDLAIADLTRAIGLDPEDPRVYLVRGGIYAQMDEYDKAMKDIRMAHTLGGRVKPGFLNALRKLSRTASDCFTAGSHKDDVLKVQGTPDSICRYEILDREVWWYGLSTIDFSIRDNRVVEWDNHGELKVKLQSSKDFISKNRGRNALVLPSGTVPPVDAIGMTGDNRYYAIIRGIPVNEGDTVEGFAVVKIDTDKVTFEKGGAVFTNNMR